MYIENLDAKFINEFAKKYCDRLFNGFKISVKKASDRWCVTCKVGLKSYILFHLKDFEFVNIHLANSSVGELMWRRELCKKFGEVYFNDLSKNLTRELEEQQKLEQEFLNQKLSTYKTYIEEITK